MATKAQCPYMYRADTGEVIRKNDNKIVSPAQSVEDPDFHAYNTWAQKGNQPDPYEKDLTPQHQKQVWEKIKEIRDRKNYSGIKLGSYWFHGDTDSRARHQLLMSQQFIPEGLKWKIMHNETDPEAREIELDPQLLADLASATLAQDNLFMQVAQAHRATMEQQADPLAYDYTSGWPSCYEDIVRTN